MQKRINWKKGMRLTDEVLSASDRCTDDAIAKALLLAAAGRFGLITSVHPFHLSMSIMKGFVDIEALSCLAITRSGQIIDVEFDTKLTNPYETRIQIPAQAEEKEYIVTVSRSANEWTDNSDGFKTPSVQFALIGAKAAVPDNAMPIARIVNEDGWHEDSVNFVPPCLFLSSHSKFEELHAQFVSLLKSIDEKTRQQAGGGAEKAISIYWPTVRQMLITANTEHEEMTPVRLLSCVQQVIAAFTIGCEIDDVLTLEDAETFNNYSRVPYNYRIAYLRIKQGLGMCYAISEKIDKFSLLQKVEAPKVEQPKPKADTRKAWDGKSI